MLIKMVHLHEQSFDWLTWCNGSVTEIFNIRYRFELIKSNKELIREYAYGWCKSDNIPCRPKIGYISVMFDTGRENWNPWWTHFTIKEFQECFPEVDLNV